MTGTSAAANLNAGLRWVYFSPNISSGDQVSSFYASELLGAQAPVLTLGGGLVTNAAGAPITSTGRAVS